MLRILALSVLALTSCVRAEQPPTSLPSSPATPPPAAAPVAAKAAAPAVTAPAAVAASPKISISQCNVDGPYAAITFDDGPHGTQTPRLLKMLKDRGIRSTFFVVGQCVAANPEIAKQIVAEGHELANHSWSHPLLSKMTQESVRDQLQRTHDVVRQETGVTMTLMRPPFGGFTATQRAWAHGTWGYQCILWDVDSDDWKHRSPAKTESIILARTRPGSIILCHDIHKTTVDAMPATLDGLLAKGLKLVSVSELIKMHKDRPATAAPARTVNARPLTSQEAAGAATSLSDLQSPQGGKPAATKAEPARP